jgi:hypothetical protein
MSKNTQKLNNFHNNLGAITGLIGKTEAMQIVRVLDSQEGLIEALKILCAEFESTPDKDSVLVAYKSIERGRIALLKAESEVSNV